MDSKCNEKIDDERVAEVTEVEADLQNCKHLEGCMVPGTNGKIYRYDADFDYMYIEDMSEEAIARRKHSDECWGPDYDFDAERSKADEEETIMFCDKPDTGEVDPQTLEQERMEQEGWIRIDDNWTCLVQGDTVRFTELVWGDDYFDKEVKGTRTNTVCITRRSCSRQLNLRIYFKVIDSSGTLPLEKDRLTWRRPETILSPKEYGQKSYRKRWADESKREEAVAECQQHERKLWDKMYKEREEEREREDQEFLEAFAEGHASAPVPDDNECNDDPVEDDDGGEHIKQLSEEEQQWVDSEWYEDVPKRTFLGSRQRKWVLDKGWRPLFDTYDEAVVGDIIWFSNPNFSGRYPNGKYYGSSIVVAEVVKVGREYFHLKLLACRGEEPHCKSGGAFRKRFGTVYYGGAYRLEWQCERARMTRYCEHTRTEFDSLKDYMNYIRPETDGRDE